jgi:peptidoglycan hydrolase-like protein with peptidoglycan-binding domain
MSTIPSAAKQAGLKIPGPPAIETLSPEQKPRLGPGSHGKAVGHLQTLLNNALGAGTLGVDEDYGGMTTDAVSLFQHKRSLAITGKVGVEEWKELSANPADPFGCQGLFWPFQAVCQIGTYMEPQQNLATIATPYVGATETTGNKMGNDARMKEIFEADDLAPGGNTDGYAWCAAFVSLCTQKLIAQYPWAFAGVTPPREPSVSRFLNSWAVGQKCLIFKPTSKVIKPMAGDIVVYTFSHIGIVETVGESAVNTIEGNTNEAGSREGTAVLQKSRTKSLVRRFIRLPVKRRLL